MAWRAWKLLIASQLKNSVPNVHNEAHVKQLALTFPAFR